MKTNPLLTSPGFENPEVENSPTLLDVKWSRRSVVGLLGAVAATLGLAGRSTVQASSGQLNIYSWPNYFSADNLKAYALRTGVTPNVSVYDSNETLFSKLNSPAGVGYDIAIPSSSWIRQMSGKGLLQEIDHSRLNLASLDQALLNRGYDLGNRYSIPKDWGLLGVLYDPDAVGGEIVTWEDFFRAGERPGVSGKIRLSVSGWETIGPDLWLQGKDWNTIGSSDIRAAGERLKRFAKHVKTFAGLDPSSVASGAIAMAQTHQAAARAAISLNPRLRWAVPGPVSELWVDNYAIVKGARNIDQAYDFISAQLQPDVQVSETRYIGFPAALAGLRERIGADVPHADLIFGGDHLDFSKLTSFIVNPETIGTYLQTQIEIQAAAG
jgi:spermidine/putrescine transport system substrate-binding protein